MEVGSIVYLPTITDGEAPNGPRALEVYGKVLEIRAGNLAFVRWDRGPDLARCGSGGGWYATESLEVKA